MTYETEISTACVEARRLVLAIEARPRRSRRDRAEFDSMKAALAEIYCADRFSEHLRLLLALTPEQRAIVFNAAAYAPRKLAA